LACASLPLPTHTLPHQPLHTLRSDCMYHRFMYHSALACSMIAELCGHTNGMLVTTQRVPWTSWDDHCCRGGCGLGDIKCREPLACRICRLYSCPRCLRRAVTVMPPMAQVGLNGILMRGTSHPLAAGPPRVCVFVLLFSYSHATVHMEPTGQIGPCIFTRPHCWSFLLL
jgi:hypothetical protein